MGSCFCHCWYALKKYHLSHYAVVASLTNERSNTQKRTLRLLTKVAQSFPTLVGRYLKKIIHKGAGIAEE